MMSQVTHVLCSVSQGSVLGPLLCLMYTADLAELAVRFGVTLHAFADDNQLYLSCRTDDTNLSVAALERCVTAISHCVSANRLNLIWIKPNGFRLALGATSIHSPKLGNDIDVAADAVRVLLECSSRQICLDKHLSHRRQRSVSSSYVSCAKSDAHSMMLL